MLRSIEHRIESLFEGVFGRAFRSHVQPVELARKLAKEMDDAKSVSLSRIYVPNEYHLYLSPKDREQFRGYEQGLLHELSDYLSEHARREGYALLTRPRVELFEDADLSVGEFGIATRLVQPPEDGAPAAAPPVSSPSALTVSPPIPVVPVPIPDEPSPPSGDTRVYGTGEPERDEDTPAPVVEPGPARAAIVVGGTRHEVERPVLTLGRARECDIVVDDPSVSRRHAELRRGPGGFTLIDLKSTNGTQVNGKAIEQGEVDDGDRITLGQTELRFERF